MEHVRALDRGLDGLLDENAAKLLAEERAAAERCEQLYNVIRSLNGRKESVLKLVGVVDLPLPETPETLLELNACCGAWVRAARGVERADLKLKRVAKGLEEWMNCIGHLRDSANRSDRPISMHYAVRRLREIYLHYQPYFDGTPVQY